MTGSVRKCSRPISAWRTTRTPPSSGPPCNGKQKHLRGRSTYGGPAFLSEQPERKGRPAGVQEQQDEHCRGLRKSMLHKAMRKVVRIPNVKRLALGSAQGDNPKQVH